MNSEQENFEKLRRLLALKRHEQPPPGYFNEFSRQVVARLQLGETPHSDSFVGRLISRAPWLERLLGGFEAKPVLAGAFGVGVCGLLVVGLVSSERLDSSPSGPSPSAPTVFATAPNQLSVDSPYERAAADHSLTSSLSATQNRSSIFESIRPQVQPINYSPKAQ